MLRFCYLLLLSFLLGSNVLAAGLKQGDAAPDFTLPDMQGHEYKLSELRKTGPVVVFFWSTECGFCRVLAPQLQKVYAEHKASGLQVVGIDIDYRMDAEVQEFVSTRKLDFIILHGSLNNADAVEAYGVPGTPTLVLVGKDGKIQFYGHTLEGLLPHLM